MSRMLRRLAVASVCTLMLFAGIAHAQKQGGVLRITHRDNPPSASIHEEATISTDMPFMGVFNNLVVFAPDAKQNRLEAVIQDDRTA